MVEFNESSAGSQAAKTVQEAQAEIDRLIGSLSKVEDRKAPVYVIVSNRNGLTGKYGGLGFNQLNADLCRLRQAVEEQAGLSTIIAYVDDRSSLTPYELQPVDPANAWQIKTLIDNLDTRLNERGREIRYVLIVGGDSIIPFHRLPNPIDDQDADVPSDNPYASRDANYFLPERAIGRMPDGEGEGIGFLHSLIQTAVTAHQRSARSKGLLNTVFGAFRPASRGEQNGHSLGYSASIWRKASRAVFEVIGDNRQLRTSPPLTYQEFRVEENPHFSYFNLHGIEDGANWYGQRDSLFPADYPVFPVALRPQDLTPSEHANSVVFTEACYGANILGKSTNDSIALRFLDSQALALVGSTCVSYGSIAPPLLGADLIGRGFWQGLQAHLSVGEALVVAKANLAKAMQDQQGYLDGEDQKTLISFVLCGDPSLPGIALQGRAAAKVLSKTCCPPILCQKRARLQKGTASDELIATVKGQIEASLPYMAQARVRATPVTFCNGDCGHRCTLARGTAKAVKGHTEDWAFTLEKDIPVNGDGAHCQVVRVTVDKRGHILKMAVSK